MPHTLNSAVGVILTQPGYYTVPPLSELETMFVGGRCEVKDFTVGREGYGKIRFLGMTEIVAGLNLDYLSELSGQPWDWHLPAG